MSTMEAGSVDTVEEALRRLGVSATTLSSGEKHALDERGYLLLPKLIETDQLERLRAAFEQIAAQERPVTGGPESGTRHLKDLVSQGKVFEGVYTHPKVLAAVYHVLGRPFGLFQLHGRDPLPGYGQQGLHADWRPRAPDQPFQIVVAIWLLDEFTMDNGATRLVPGTHRLKGPPPKGMADPARRHPDQISVIAPAGSVVIFNGHLWHSGTRNRSQGPRRALQCSFAARENLPLANRPWNEPEGLGPAVRYVLGF